MNFNFRFERRAFLARLWPLLAAGADPVGAAAVLTRGAATVERGTSSKKQTSSNFRAGTVISPSRSHRSAWAVRTLPHLPGEVGA